MAEAGETLIEEGTELSGSLSSSCPVVVKGRFKGDVTAPSLTVAASGAVDGKMTVTHVSSRGELSGELDADTAELTGKVGNNMIVRAKSLDLALSSKRGKVELVFGQASAEPGKNQRRR